MDDDELPSITKLDESIKKVKVKIEGEKKEESYAGRAVRTSVDLLSGVAVGAFIGYYVDKWVDSFPLFFVICFIFGAAGGALNIYKDIKRNNLDE